MRLAPVLLSLVALALLRPPALGDEFIGPLAGWANAKADYGAVGDGQADDTAALQKAFDDLGTPGKPRVLYLPAGTYRITQTLTMKTRLGISLLGEDPATTKIVWDGPPEGAMTWFNGVAYSRWGRLTWDGAGKAKVAIDHGWEGKEPHAGTHNEHADEVFQDVGFGIKGGSRGFMDAETAVLRCKFLRCSQAGVSIENFNALDWFLWHCLFEDCRVGVTNTFGAGHYHVYKSVFRRSQVSDFTMGHLGYFSIRDNYSRDSQAFMIASQFSAGALITIQGNTIVHSQQPPIQVHNLGPMLFIDNTILSRPGTTDPPLQMTNSIPWGADLVAVGNTFTVENPIKCDGRVRELDNKVAAVEVPPEPSLPPAAPNRHRQIIEVAPGAGAAEIQAAITQSAQYRGQRPVIHLPAGEYKITETLVIPADLDVQLVGDGYLQTTVLSWAGGEDDPVIRLAGPSRATLRDLEIRGGGKAEGIMVERCDQPGARVFSEQLSTEGGLGVGLLVDGLDLCEVSMHDYYHSGASEVSVRVIGGPQRAAGRETSGRVALLGGGSSNNAYTYEVQKGGYLITRDMWYETGQYPGFIKLSDSGTFTFHAGIIALPPNPDLPAVLLDSFRGKASFLSTELASVGPGEVVIRVRGEGRETKVLVLGAITRGREPYFFNESPHAQAPLLSSHIGTDRGREAIDNQGPQDEAFLREMLAQTRKEGPRPLDEVPAGLTDVRFYRVFVDGCTVGVHLQPN